MKRALWILLLLALSTPERSTSLFAQQNDTTLFRNLRWRMIGPHRGGRTVGVAGVPDQPNVLYIGVNNGGVWRTSDYGRTWRPIFDSQSTGSIGALAVAPSNPNVLYVGTGEGLQRPDLSVGDGMFKSTDGGTTWAHIGLDDAQQIGAVLVDPVNPQKLFVAVLGHPYGANAERGVFRSTDGGASWKKILYKDENTGAIALSFDPANSAIVYADLWSSRLGPWENGEWQGTTSGLFKSTDGGDSWKQLTNGLPGSEEGVGRIGFCVAPGDPSRIYATVDAKKKGGIYRSDDAGEHWNLVNTEDRIWGRGSDFAEIKVHPTDKNQILVANTSTYRSMDGGVSFTAIKGAPGGDDYHTVWINPLHPDIIVLASDQGAVVSVNGGSSWSSWYNQPTAQFYHVITDNEFPYNVYGGQQESGSVGISSRGNDGQITIREWHPVAADEWAYIAPDPLHPNIIYGGKVSHFDKLTEQVQSVAPEAIRSGSYRFIRTSPLMFSPADPSALYLASNVLFKTTTGGMKWEIISPDLTRKSPDVPPSIGIFRTPELAKQPQRGVIYSLGLSPLDRGVIWAGTDDGLVHLSRDGGKTWKDITPSGMTAWSKVAGIDAGHFDAGTAYVAVNSIRLDDMRPHIFRTHDGGATWQEIVKGLPANGPVNAVREDPERKGLLFAGTERAVYVSLDDGEQWLPLRLNMPATSIRDLVVHNSDVVVGTHGRSFWILDNISMLRQFDRLKSSGTPVLFKPDTAFRVRWNANTDTPIPPDEPSGENPPDGAMIDYYLPKGAKEVSMEIADQSQRVVRHYSTADPPEIVRERELRIPTYWIRPEMRLSAAAGMHRFMWDLHYAPPDSIPRSYPISAILHNTASSPNGPWMLPGTYSVVLIADGKRFEQPITVKIDPRVKATETVLKSQHDLSLQCYNGLAALNETSRQIGSLQRRIGAVEATVTIPALKDSLTHLMNRLSQLKGGGAQGDVDVMYFTAEGGSAIKETISGLQTKLLYLMLLLQSADATATDSQAKACADTQETLKAMMQWWGGFKETGLSAINKDLTRNNLKPIPMDEK